MPDYRWTYITSGVGYELWATIAIDKMAVEDFLIASNHNIFIFVEAESFVIQKNKVLEVLYGR